jgi:ElaA protein
MLGAAAAPASSGSTPLAAVADAAVENIDSKITWSVLLFDELSTSALYDVLKLRQDVFVLEQTCLFPDIDGADQQCLHLLGYDESSRLVGYSRMGGAGLSYPDALTIGRVIVAPSARGRGLSYSVMRRSIDAVRSAYGHQPITIGAQAHLQALYGQLGFEASSAEYEEDGIPHIDMTLHT